MAQGPSPLLGYNTNVRHKGKLYHIQTEDSGVNHPHVITHLFADGGRIVSSKKTSYQTMLGADDLKPAVKKLMQDQHKGMFIALRDGAFDEQEGLLGVPAVVPTMPADTTPGTEPAIELEPIPLEVPASKRPPAASRVDVEALERAAMRLASPDAARGGLYQTTQPTRGAGVRAKSKPPESIFGSDLLSEKSLDEVILSYLATDLEEDEKG
jgi:hypothetical protein